MRCKDPMIGHGFGPGIRCSNCLSSGLFLFPNQRYPTNSVIRTTIKPITIIIGCVLIVLVARVGGGSEVRRAGGCEVLSPLSLSKIKLGFRWGRELVIRVKLD